MKIITLLSCGLLALTANAETRLKALILDGQNNHDVWPKSTVMMKQYLEESGPDRGNTAAEAGSGFQTIF